MSKFGSQFPGRPAGYSSDENEDDFYVPTTSGLAVGDYDEEFPGMGGSPVKSSKIAARRTSYKNNQASGTQASLNWSKNSRAQRLNSVEVSGGVQTGGKMSMHGDGASSSSVDGKAQYDSENEFSTWVDEVLKPYQVCRNRTDHTGVLCDLEEVQVEWLSKVSKAYTVSQKSVSGVLEECLTTVCNPHIAILFILEHPASFTGGKRRQVRYTVLTCFKEFLVNHGLQSAEAFRNYVNDSVQLRALALLITATDSSDSASDLMVHCFQLLHMSEDLMNNVVMKIIRGMMDKKKFLRATSCIVALELHEKFGVDEVCYPLLFQGHLTHIQKYLGTESRLQLAFLKLLDYLLDTDVRIDNVISDYDVPLVKMELLTNKNLLKVGVRLMKLYQIPEVECPNITFNQSHRSLRYWFYQRNSEANMDKTRWEELISSVVGTCPRLQLELIDLFIDHADLDSSARWAVKYNLPVKSLPHQIHERVKRAYSTRAAAGANDQRAGVSDTEHQATVFIDDVDYDNVCRCEGCRKAGVCTRYHQLKISIDHIVWIENREKFYEFLDDISDKKEFVGMDAEWKPTHIGIHSSARVALLQVATSDIVYLLDMLALSELLDEDDWKRFADVLFCSEQVVVIGYGIDKDLTMLIKSLPALQKHLTRARLLDLSALHSMLRNLCPDALYAAAEQQHEAAATDDTQHSEAAESVMRVEEGGEGVVGGSKGDERGLSELVKLCLGKPLEKRMQLSDWERRPLRKSQVVYAALDAHCLLEVYDILKNKMKDTDFTTTLKQMTRSKPINTQPTKLEKQQLKYQKGSKPARSVSRTNTSRSPGGASMRPSELRVVCDTMLMGLGRQLRSCGVDVRLLQSTDCHEKTAQLSLQEKRIILTTGVPYQQLSQLIEPEFCYCVMASNLCDQIKEVFNYFNISVTSEDIFSRCQVCNNDRYLRVRSHVMKQAWLKSQETLNSDAHTSCEEKSFETVCDEKLLQTSCDNKSLQTSCDNKSLQTSCDEESLQTPCEDNSSLEVCTASAEHSEQSIRDDQGSSGFDALDLEKLCVTSGAPILMEDLNLTRFDRVAVFYVCSNCGKVYWEGSHRRAANEKFSQLITKANNS